MVGLNDINTDVMSNKLEETLNIIKKVNAQFKNPVNNYFLATCFVQPKYI